MMNLRTISGISIIALGAIASLMFFLAPTLMQNMEKDETVHRSPGGVTLPSLHDPRIVIRKKARALDLYDGDKLVKSYTIVLGFAPVGDKEREGDGKTPEGEFFVFTKNPQSKFHLSLGVSYPSTDDAERGFTDGVISKSERDAIIAAITKKKMPPQNTALGGEIYIHGGGVTNDWTWGCPALTNSDIEEIYNAVPVGTTVTIEP